MDTQPPTMPAGGRRPQAHMLGDYSGRAAAGVADELRRIGLRPGVQRVDAPTPEEVGAILAQDPPAGAHVARNSVITLYVGAAPHDPAMSERPIAHQSTDTMAAATGPRRRRKPGHAHTLNPTPATLEAATYADGDAEQLHASDTREDYETGAARSDHLEAVPVDVQSQDDAAPDRRRVHHDPPRAASPAPPEASVGAAGSPPAVNARTLLTPLSGLPRRFALRQWRHVPRWTRLAVTIGLVCVLALVALALADHHESSPQRPASATATRQVGSATLKPPRAVRSGPRSRERSRTLTHGSGQHGSRTAPAARPARSNTPAPPVTPVESSAPPAVPAPAAPAVQTSEPSAPTTVDGQVPGGPFSP